MSNVKKIPDGFHSVTPCLSLKNSNDAINFYQKAFNAQKLYVMPGPDGKGVMHASIKIGDSIIMLGDESPEQGCSSAETLGNSPISLFLYVNNVDDAFKKAIDAGCVETMPVCDMFWGDRCGSLKDPFGYSWMLATHTADLSEAEIQEGAKAFCAAAGKS